MTEYYSLGHKIVAVVLALVLMGFGWPAVNPASIYAESDSETEQSDSAAKEKAEQEAAAKEKAAEEAAAKKAKEEAAAKKEQEAKAKEAAEKKAAEQAAAKKAEQSNNSAKTKAGSSSTKSSSSSDSSKDDKSESDEVSEYKISLDLGNASIKVKSSNNQVVTAPATKVTVPAGKDFKFTVTPNEGYELTKVTSKSSSTKTLKADSSDVYTISASDLTEGMKITLKTKKQESSTTETDATPIEETEDTDANKAAEEEVADNAGETESDDVNADESNENAQDAEANDANADAGISVASLDDLDTATVSDDGYTVTVGGTLDLTGSSGYHHSWSSSSKKSATVENTSESSDRRATAGTATVTGVKAGTVTITHTYYTSSWGGWPHTEIFTVTVKKSEPITSLEISGANSVEQFKSTTLTTNADTDVTWTSSDPSIATVGTSTGKVTGVKEGAVTITATTVTEEGLVLTATHDVTVSASTASSTTAYLFFQNSPTANPDTNDTAAWFPSSGAHSLGIKLNLEGITWSGANSYDNVGNRIMSWPDGSTGTSWELDKSSSKYSSYWYSVYNAWKSTLEKEQGTTITEDDIESISVHPYKISNNSCGYHLDCKVEVKCKKAITANFYLQDAGSTGFVQYGEGVTYKLVEGKATVKAPSETPAETKTEGGVTYKFMGWYADQACTQSVSFPDTVTSSVNYYAKYVPMDQTIQVNYYLEGTTTSVAPSKTITGLIKGKKVTESAIDISGYDLVSAKTQTAVAGTDHEINFYYKASEVGYTVEYYWNGSDTPIETDSSAKGTVGQSVTVSPKAINGYTAVSSDSQSITLDKDASKNVIKFYYYKNVELAANSDSVTYDGKEHSVSGFSGAPDGADFSAITVGATGTDAGDYPAKFANGTVGAIDGSGNYIVTVATNGSLHISPVTDEVTIKVTGNTDTQIYDGKSHSVDGYSIDESALPSGVELSDVQFTGKAEASGTNADAYNMGLKAADFALSEQAAKNYTNVKFEVEDGTLTISKKAASITAGSAEKEYDGTALTTNEFTTEGFVEGQGIAYATIEGSQTVVGSSPSTVKDNSWTAKEGTNLNNYEITTNNGTLTVKDRATKYEMSVVASSAEFTYDGAEHKTTGITGTTFTNEKGVTFTVTGLSAEDAVATDAGEYGHNIQGTAKVVDPDGNDVTAQFTVNTQDGKLTIKQKAATITAASDQKEYDGDPLTTDKFTTSGFVEGQGIASATIEGSQTVVGSSPSTVKDNSWTAQEGTNLNNYTITTQPGTLTVTNRSAKYKIEVEANSAEYTYDGTEKSVSGLKTTTFTVKGKTYTVEGLEASGVAGTNAGSYTNTVSGTAVVKDAAGNDVTAQFEVTVKPGTLKINKRDVTITSKDATKVYDGQPLTREEVDVSGDGIAEADKDSVSYTFTGTQTEVGESKNSFTVSGLSDTNYEVTTKPGTLEVTPVTDKVTVTITEHGGSYTYDGTEKTATGYDVSSSNALYTASCFSFSGNANVSGTDAGTYEMKLKASDFKNMSKNFSNVEFKIVDATLTIAKRNVKLTSASDEKVYDGNALTNHEVTVSEDGFAEGEGATYDVTGTITNAGKKENTFTYTLNSGTKAGNYNIVTETGELVVTPITDEVVVKVVGNKGGQKYSGSKQTVEGYAISADNTLYNVNDDVEFGGTAKAEGTDADTYQMGLAESQFKNTNGNFTNVKFEVTDGELVIAKRQVGLKSGSKEKEYDGTALVEKSVVCSGDGFVDGEGATYDVTGSQTLPGSSENVFTYSLKKGTDAKNYEITTEYGTLTVTNRETQYEITVEANSETATYDGQQHSAMGLKTTSFVVNDKTYNVSGLTTEDPAETNAGTYTNNITGTPVVTDEGGNIVTDQFKVSTKNGSLTIGKREVTLESQSGSKVYDGTPLTMPEVAVSDELFKSETSNVTATGSVTNVSEGEVTNTITYTAGEKFDKNNYKITKTEGKLWITSKSIEDPSMNVDTPANKVYNGQSQKWAPTVKDGDKVLTEDVDYTVKYSTDNFTDATGAITVTIKGVGNYEGSVARSYQITPAPYKVVTYGTYRIYNGKALTAGGKIEGIVNGEDAGFEVTGSQTEVGSSDNTYVVKWDKTAKKSNYEFAGEEIGKLTVGEYSGQIIVTTVGGTFTYDGQAHGATVSAPQLPDGYHFASTPSSSASATDVTSEPVKATADNLVILNAQDEDVTNKLNIKHIDGTIVVNPATLAVTTPDATKVYDGTPLTAAGSYSGLVNDETIDFKTTGTQTEKGESTNTYEIAWTGTAKQSNYTISEDLGTLTVTEQSIVPDDPAYKDVTISDPEGKTYDGVELKWVPEVKDAQGNALAEGTDYTVTYKRDGKVTTDFINVGAIEVVITGTGNYTGSVTKSYKITQAPLEVSTPDATKVYDGTPLTAAATAENISGLVAGETATVKATGSQTKVGDSANTYSGIEWGTAKESNYYVKSETEGTLKVTEQSIVPDDPAYKGVQINDPADKPYDGDEHKWAPEVTAKDGSKLVEGTDYTVAYTRDGKETNDFTNVGAIEVVITGTGNYTGSVTKSYKITQRPVTLTSESHTFTYNGKAQSWNEFTCSDKLFASQVDDLGCKVTVRKAGERKTNTVSYIFKSGFSADNYEITNNFGTLYVKNSEDEIVVTTTGGTFTYDGKPHGATVEVSKLPDGYTLDTASSSATATDVADGEVVATANTLVIRNAEGDDVTSSLKVTYIDGTIKINPKAYSVATGSDTKVYDGTALLGSEADGNEVSGLVSEADATFTVTGSQTEVGGTEHNNTYTLEFASDQMAKNYTLESESLGTLTVTKQSIVPDPDNPESYKGIQIDDPKDETYDGGEHKWAPEVTAKDGSKLVEGEDYTVKYSTDNFTDVTGVITVTITGTGNYTGTVAKTYQITKREVTLTSESDSKVYDGTALTKPDVTVTGDGFVEGEVSNVTATGSVTNVSSGEVTNTITYTPGEKFKETNYNITKEEGELWIISQTIDPDDPAYKGVEVGQLKDLVYNGKTQEQKPSVTSKDGTSLKEGTDYTVSFSKDTKNVGTVAVTITGKGNYTGSVERSYQITPKGYTVTTDGATKVYNGKPLTADGKIEGIVDGEDAGFEVTGSQTEVGSSDNTYNVKWDKTAKKSNYKLEGETIGKLVVTESADEIVVTTTGGTFTYDGQAHGATVEVSSLPEGYTLDTASSSATATNVADGEVAATADTLIIRNAEGEDVTSKLKITYVNGVIKIVPAELRVTTGSATKIYDGTALTNSDLKVTGLVGSDAVTAKTTGAQTEVGSSANTYQIDWGTIDANNYSIVESLGTLTVTKAAVTPSDNDGNNGGNGGTTRTTTAATPAAAAAAAVNNVVNTVTGNTEGETIYDAENPLGTAEAECWVHYYMIICMILTALYGIGVWAHRANYTRRLRKDMDDVMNDGDGINPEKGELAGTSTVTNQA